MPFKKVGSAVSGARNFVSSEVRKATNFIQSVATPFKTVGGAIKNVFVSNAVAKRLENTQNKVKKFFCGTTEKIGGFFKEVGTAIADGAKAVGNFVKNINRKKVGDVAATVGLGAAAVGAIVITAGAATPAVAAAGYVIAAGTASYTVADTQQIITDGKNNYIRDTVFGGNQKYYDDSHVVMDIAGLGYTAITSNMLNKGSGELKRNINNKVPNEAKKIVESIKNNNGSPLKGYKGGKIYQNTPKEGAQKLPEGVTYKEYDIYPKIDGQSRGAERVVIGDDGSVWYTNDHYKSFIRME